MTEPLPWELPKSWCWSEAESLIDEISTGKSFKCDERVPHEDEVGVVKVSAVTWGSYNELESKTCTRADLVNPELFVQSGDFLFSRANTIELVGACVIAERVTRKVMLSDKILRFAVRRGWERWLLWSLRSSHGRAEIERLATGNQDSMRNIGQSRILSIRVPLPAQGEQRRIVEAVESYITRLDDAVATLERVERNLKRYRASVLKSAVEGRLVPTEAALAKQEGRTYEPASVLLERILTERRRRWSESGKKGKYQEPIPPDTTNLPKLPEGWCWATVEQMATLITDGDHNPPPRVADGVPHLTAKHIKRWRILFGGCSYVTPEGFEQTRARYEPMCDDVIVTCVGTVGETAVVPTDCVFSADRNLAAVRLLPHGVMPRFLMYILTSPDIRTRILGASGSTAQPHLYLSDLRSLPIPVPPESEQHRIVEYLDSQMSDDDSMLALTHASRRRCNRLRQSILKWAFEGKLADQDPTDEPASVLLERIKAERDTAKPAKATTPQRKAAKKKARA